MKCCDVPVFINSRISLCSWFCIYFLSTLLLLYCALWARVTCKRCINGLLHYVTFDSYGYRYHADTAKID